MFPSESPHEEAGLYPAPICFSFKEVEDDMAIGVKQMMEAANAVVPRITPAQAQEMIAKSNTLVVDVRDAPELEKSGKVAGAVHVSRGMLKFRADPDPLLCLWRTLGAGRQGAQRDGL
jgi:hypothetical protein